MGKMSKDKGRRGEQQIVDIFNKVFGEHKFKRVPMSGAIGTSSKNLSENVANVMIGDIIVPDNFPYFIEVKNYKDIDLWKIFESGVFPDKFEDERDKQLEQIKITKKEGILLIFKSMRREWLVMLDERIKYVKCFNFFCETYINDISFIKLNNKRMILKLNDFLNIIKNENVI